MTWKQFAEQYLDERGCMPSQIVAVSTLAKEHKLFDELKDRWADQVDTYPAEMQCLVAQNLRRVTLEWFEQNLPQAWNKHQFID